MTVFDDSDPAGTILQLIQDCREPWGPSRDCHGRWGPSKERAFDLVWKPHSANPLLTRMEETSDLLDGSGMRHQLCAVSLTTSNDERRTGNVFLPGSHWELTHDYLTHEKPLRIFTLVARVAGRIAEKHCRGELSSYLSEDLLIQSDPENWWIACMLHYADVIPPADGVDSIVVGSVRSLTLQALEALAKKNLNSAFTYDQCLPIPKAEFCQLIGLTDKTVKKHARLGKIPIHADGLSPENTDKIYWVEREYLMNLQRCRKLEDQ